MSNRDTRQHSAKKAGNGRNWDAFDGILTQYFGSRRRTKSCMRTGKRHEIRAEAVARQQEILQEMKHKQAEAREKHKQQREQPVPKINYFRRVINKVKSLWG